MWNLGKVAQLDGRLAGAGGEPDVELRRLRAGDGARVCDRERHAAAAHGQRRVRKRRVLRRGRVRCVHGASGKLRAR